MSPIVNPLTTSGWGSNLTFSVPGYTPTQGTTPPISAGWGATPTFTPPPAFDFSWMKSGGNYGSVFPPASIAPAPTAIPAGPVSNWAAFTQGLLGLGVQFYLQKDAQKRQDELRKQGVAADVVQHPGGGYAVVERPSFIQSPMGLAVIVGGGALVLWLLLKKR